MLKNINDKAEHARELLDLLHGIEAKINLIVFNPHEGMQHTGRHVYMRVMHVW